MSPSDMDAIDISGLDALCLRHGIATSYRDGNGVTRQVPTSTKQALLAVLGVTFDEQRAPNMAGPPCPLEPVLVWRIDAGAPHIMISVAAAQAETAVQWELALEDGQSFSGTFVPAQLPPRNDVVNSTNTIMRCDFSLPTTPPNGYHRFILHGISGDDACTMVLILVPACCYQTPSIEARRTWGIDLQLYALRSSRNWGMGDFSDLRAVTDYAADCGADLVGINPLHALYPACPTHANPYCPSNRLFINLLYLDLEAIPESRECPAFQDLLADAQFQAQLRGLRGEELVQYAAVANLKLAALEHLYQCFFEHELRTHSKRAKAFRVFCVERGRALRNQTCFDALQAHFANEETAPNNCSDWPAAYRNPDSEAVNNFAISFAARLDFYAYLYWQADQQLAAVKGRALDQGLGIGLCQTLAFSAAADGAEVWANQSLFASDVSLGAPPSAATPSGHNWRLPAYLPTQMQATGYAAFGEILRRSMRHAGALRIEQLTGLARQFWIPSGASPEHGTYVDFPFNDLLGIVALESQRNQCLVINNDDGTGDAALLTALAAAGVFSTDVLWHTRDANGAFKPPADFPIQALLSVSTPQQPTLAGFWQGHDLDLRSTLRLFPNEEYRQSQIVRRAQDRTRLLMALEQAGLLPAASSVYPASALELSTDLVQAIHLYLAQSPATLVLVRPEDVLGQLPQAYVENAADAYPNWRYKLPFNVEEWPTDPRFSALVAALRKSRSRLDLHSPTPAPLPPPPGGVIPRATYRLQFHRDFTFAQATTLIPYFAALGISHCYASPYLQARAGSTHGYDIVDHSAINPEIGTREEFEHFVAALHAHKMAQIIDMVPNHMAVMGNDNAWWLDVLENGQSSLYAEFFDIDWETRQSDGTHKILLPVLGDHYAKVLERGELRLSFDVTRGDFGIAYFNHRFPIDPREYPRIMSHHLDRLSSNLGTEDLNRLKYESLVTAFGHLPLRSEPGPETVAERARDKELLKRRLAALCAVSPDIANFLAENIAYINGLRTEQASSDRLHELISAQAYRLAYWRVASDEINYRRFFDINELAALRMESTQVFQATHAFVFELIEQGKIAGLRIDHPDGLYDPAVYFSRLQHQFAATQSPLGPEHGADSKAIYVVVEKILSGDEALPDDWQVHGTTGYDFANLVNGLFVKANTAEKLRKIYETFIGAPLSFDDTVYRSKILIMRGALASELNVLANQLGRIAQSDRNTCDYTLNNLRRALTELVACFPVYRTYINDAGVSQTDLHSIDRAIAAAKKRSQAADVSIFDLLRDVVNTRIGEGKNFVYREAVVRFARKLQQYTAPVMAKGCEDTSFYIYNRLISLNEVGGDPHRYGIDVGDFHRANQARIKHWPHAMLATSTHDSKRSEDVRARINVLSEIPDEWRRALTHWQRLNRRKKRVIEDIEAPSRNDEYLLYQTLLGVWPQQDASDTAIGALRQRVEDYMLKAVREAKLHSSWLNPNADYEEAVTHFVGAILVSDNQRFLAAFQTLAPRIAWFGRLNSLAQVLLKLAAPGVPDIYQGNELWDFSLVDPDNRRPVDYQERQSLLQQLLAHDDASDADYGAHVQALLDEAPNGAIKLHLTRQTLLVRQQAAALFRDGDYIPLRCHGGHAEHLCAFARTYQKQVAVVIVPRLTCTLMKGAMAWPVGTAVWSDTIVDMPAPIDAWQNVLTRTIVRAQVTDTQCQLSVADLFHDFPFAVLHPYAGRVSAA